MRLKFQGNLADNGEIDFYDLAKALDGFQRSLALTTHLILNGEVITQSPSLKNAKIIVSPPQKGSFVVLVTILGGIGYLGTRPTDTPLGHLVHSAYDYVMKNAFGVKLDYEKSIGDLLEQRSKEIGRTLNQGRLDDLTEKCEIAIKDMHRPIVQSETAERANVSRIVSDQPARLVTRLSAQTYDSLRFERRTTIIKQYEGLVSSYNVNTKVGRFYLVAESRTVPFKLSAPLAESDVGALLARSMERLAQRKLEVPIKFGAFENQSRSGRLRSLFVMSVTD
ncbi:MAG: hypothetical protein AAFR51_17750 [Pseudomonadota bacterium]